jgi:hypothetical protein
MEISQSGSNPPPQPLLSAEEEGVALFRAACRGIGLDDSDTEDGRWPGDSDEEDGGEHTSSSPESVHGPLPEVCKTHALTFFPFPLAFFFKKKVRVKGKRSHFNYD